MVAFKLVVKVVANPLLRLLRRKPAKPPPGPPKPRKTYENLPILNRNKWYHSIFDDLILRSN